MRYSELEAQQVQEAPAGFFSQLGNQIASKLGSASAQGRLETGQVANYIYKQFRKNLGASNQKATPEVLTGFLQSVGLPKPSIQAANDSVVGQSDVKTDPATGQATLNASADPTATLNRKQIGQFILTAVQHANQSGELSFTDQPASVQPTSAQSDQAPEQDAGKQRTSDRMNTELKQLHDQVLGGDVQAAQALVQSLSDINQMVKRHAHAANKSIGRGVQDEKQRSELVKQVRTIAKESYDHLTRVFKHANITWKQVGYQPLISEQASNTVTLKPINNNNKPERTR